MEIQLTDHEYIVLHDAVQRHEKALAKKKTSSNPASAILLTTARSALENVRAACPDHLIDMLGLEGGEAVEA